MKFYSQLVKIFSNGTENNVHLLQLTRLHLWNRACYQKKQIRATFLNKMNDDDGDDSVENKIEVDVSSEK